MLDAGKYAQYFPDESQELVRPGEGRVSAQLAPSPALLAALSQLEREFKEILRSQQQEHADRSE